MPSSQRALLNGWDTDVDLEEAVLNAHQPTQKVVRLWLYQEPCFSNSITGLGVLITRERNWRHVSLTVVLEGTALQNG